MTSSPPKNKSHRPLPDLERAKRPKWPSLKGGKSKARDNSIEPEVIPPHIAQALDTLEARQAEDWAVLNQLETLAKLMDAQFAVPFTSLRVGLDSLVGLIPGIGDTISFGVSGYIIFKARKMGANSGQTLRMVFNSFIDWLIGLVPIIGDLLDVGWQSNMRNTAYLREIMESKWAKERSDLFRNDV